MATGIAISFPSGRFHATPWGRHVNESVAEWPPSPWRLLRALVATWKRKLDGADGMDPQTVKSLLRDLAQPPLFVLPPATASHTRHFMPWFKKGPQDRTLVFDAFVALSREHEVVTLWPDVNLAEPQLATLERLAGHLGYLGRAEALCSARCLGEEEAGQQAVRASCRPLAGEAPEGHEIVRVLCADPGTAFSNEHTPKHERTEGRGKNKRTLSTPIYDPDWHLCIETLELHKQRWSDPPGSRWVHYSRPSDCLATRPTHATPRPRTAPTVAHFALDANVLPLVQETLPTAELARRTVMGIYRRIMERRLYGSCPAPEGAPLPRSEVFSGKDAQGLPLTGHRHALYLPDDADRDGRLDRLTIVAEMGFGPVEVQVIDQLRRLKRREGEPIELLLLGLGRLDTKVARVLGPSAVWISATPFVASRHQKARGRRRDPHEFLGMKGQRDFARLVLLEELARLRERRRDLPEPVAVEPLNGEQVVGIRNLRPLQFKRYRQKRNDDGGRRAAGAFRITFPAPVRGPICLGHSSHFGLGLFVPDDSAQ